MYFGKMYDGIFVFITLTYDTVY